MPSSIGIQIWEYVLLSDLQEAHGGGRGVRIFYTEWHWMGVSSNPPILQGDTRDWVEGFQIQHIASEG